MHISSQLLYDLDGPSKGTANTVLVIGEDPDSDPEHQLCAIFIAIREEQKVQLTIRYRRKADKLERQEGGQFEEFGGLDKQTQVRFELRMAGFYAEAMRAFGFEPFDDSLPENDPGKQPDLL